MKKPVKKKEEQVQGRSDFIARISHELRTPLSAIMGFTEQLMQTTIDEEQEKYLKIIDKSAEHMVSLINDILLFSRSESNKIRFDDSPFSLMDVIKHSIADMEYKARKNKLEITYETDRNLDIIVMGDAFRLRQILNNLLSNAVKFTSEGWIKLICKLEYEEEDTYYIMFRVIDTGIGIRKDKLKDIFNPYRQADTKASVMKGGTGLGLSICKNLIDLQGGSLSVLSKPNKGSEFKFVIPYKKTSLRNIKTTEPGGLDTSILSGKRILLVDDDSVNRLLGETVLRKINCDVTISDSGKIGRAS